MKYIAYCTKGLEFVVEKEILTTLPDAHIKETGDKRVIFETDMVMSDLTHLRTVDDLGILVASMPSVQSEDQLLTTVNKIEFLTTKDLLAKTRSIENRFSLTLSIVGNPHLDQTHVTEKLSQLISHKYGWEYTEKDHTNFDIRIFLDKKTGYISVRLTPQSLYERKYKKSSLPGSLKPSIAACLVWLATDGQQKEKQKIVDTFCGSGTILAEAFLMGNEVYGADIQTESVLTTQTNLKWAGDGYVDRIKHADATTPVWATGYFDAAISNMPWDKQIEIKSISSLYEGVAREYSRIIKPGGTICVLLTKPELFIKYVKKYMPDAHTSTIQVGLLGQTPTIVLINREK